MTRPKAYVTITVPVQAVHDLYSTGWFGRPGVPGGKVHVVHRSTSKPICGQVQHPDNEYQWCAMRIEERYVECGKCKAIIAPIVAGAAA